MKTLSTIRNQRGFTLTNMIVGLAIAGIVAAGFVSAVQMMTRSKKTLDVKSEASQFIDVLQQSFKRPQSCENNLANGTNRIDIPAAGATAAEVAIKFGGIDEGKEVARGVTVTKFKLKATGKPVVVPGVGLRSVGARVEVVIADTSRTPPAPLRSRMIPVQITFDGSGTITACGAVSLEAQVCAELDGDWDAAAPKGLQCMPTDKCLYGGSYSSAPIGGMDANNVLRPGFINTFTGAQSCPTSFSAQQTGTVSVARKASKYKVVTDTYPTFTCVRCRQPVADQASVTYAQTDLDLTGDGYDDAVAGGAAGDANKVNIKSIWDRIHNLF